MELGYEETVLGTGREHVMTYCHCACSTVHGGQSAVFCAERPVWKEQRAWRGEKQAYRKDSVSWDQPCCWGWLGFEAGSSDIWRLSNCGRWNRKQVLLMAGVSISLEKQCKPKSWGTQGRFRQYVCDTVVYGMCNWDSRKWVNTDW